MVRSVELLSAVVIARCASATLLCVVLSLASAARAQDVAPSDADLERVRELAREGGEAMMAERWEDAYVALRSAYDLAPLPQILMNLAGAELQTDRIRAAISHYEAFLRAASADPALASLAPSAREALESARARLGRLRIERTRVIAGDDLRLDGAPIHEEVAPDTWEVDPGPHAVAVVRDGAEVAREELVVPRGGEATATLEVPLPPRRVRREVLVPPPAAPVENTDDGSVLSSPWLWIAVVLVVGAGIAATAVALSRDPSDDPVGNAMPGRIVLD